MIIDVRLRHPFARATTPSSVIPSLIILTKFKSEHPVAKYSNDLSVTGY
jgi:hypothetical protein